MRFVQIINIAFAFTKDRRRPAAYAGLDMGDVGEKLKSLSDQEKLCQSFPNVPNIPIIYNVGREKGM